MKKLICIFVGVSIVIISVVVFMMQYRSHGRVTDTNSAKLNNNSNTSNVPTNLPDGIVLAGDMVVDTAYDTQNLASLKIPFLTDGVTGDFAYPFFSPRNDLVARATNQGKTLSVISVPLGHVFQVATAPTNTVFVHAAWSGNGRYLVAGLQKAGDEKPMEGAWPSSFMQIDVYTGETKIIISSDDLKNLGATFLLPTAVSNDGKNIVFSWADEDGVWEYYSWSAASGLHAMENMPTKSVNVASNQDGQQFLWWTTDGAVVTRSLTATSGVRIRTPNREGDTVSWKPESSTLVYFVKRGSEYVVMVQDGSSSSKELSVPSYLPEDILWSPDNASLYLKKTTGTNISFDTVSAVASSNPKSVKIPKQLANMIIYGFVSNQTLSEPVQHLLAREVTDWSRYEKTTESNVLADGQCPNQTAAYHALSKAIEAKPRYRRNLGGGTPILWTANPTKATDANVSKLVSDKDICGVGFWHPVKAFPDRVLWTMGCGGMGPDVDSPTYLADNSCSVIEPYLDQIMSFATIP